MACGWYPAQSLCAAKKAALSQSFFQAVIDSGRWAAMTGGEGSVQSDHPAAAVRSAVGHGDEIRIGREPRILGGWCLHPDGGGRVKRSGQPDRPAVGVDPRHSGRTGTGSAAGATGHAHAGPFPLDQRNSIRRSGGICDLQAVLLCPRSYTIELRPLIDHKVVDRGPAQQRESRWVCPGTRPAKGSPFHIHSVRIYFIGFGSAVRDM